MAGRYILNVIFVYLMNNQYHYIIFHFQTGQIDQDSTDGYDYIGYERWERPIPVNRSTISEYSGSYIYGRNGNSA